MPLTKFEGYNASDVRSDKTRQNKLAGVGVRGVVAAHGARRRAPVSRINRWSNAVRRQRREVMERTLRNFSGDFRATLLQLLPFFRLRRTKDPMPRSSPT